MLDALSATQRQEVVAAARAGSDQSAAFINALATCRARHGWSDAALRDAVNHTVGAALQADAVANAPLDLASLAMLDAIIDSLSIDELRDILTRDASRPGYAAFVERVNASPLGSQPAMRTFAGRYLATVAMDRVHAFDFERHAR